MRSYIVGKLCRFTNLEAENMRSLERADMEDKKITELEEELRVRQIFLTRAVILDSAIFGQLDEFRILYRKPKWLLFKKRCREALIVPPRL